MKGRLFSATMLVIVLVMVLAVPAAGKPPQPTTDPTVSVQKWTKPDCSSTGCYFDAQVISWQNAPSRPNLWLYSAVVVCDGHGKPPAKSCSESWTTAYYAPIPDSGGSGSVPVLHSYVEADKLLCGATYFLLVVMYDSALDEYLAWSAFAPYTIKGFCP